MHTLLRTHVQIGLHTYPTYMICVFVCILTGSSGKHLHGLGGWRWSTASPTDRAAWTSRHAGPCLWLHCVQGHCKFSHSTPEQIRLFWVTKVMFMKWFSWLHFVSIILFYSFTLNWLRVEFYLLCSNMFIIISGQRFWYARVLVNKPLLCTSL